MKKTAKPLRTPYDDATLGWIQQAVVDGAPEVGELPELTTRDADILKILRHHKSEIERLRNLRKSLQKERARSEVADLPEQTRRDAEILKTLRHHTSEIERLRGLRVALRKERVRLERILAERFDHLRPRPTVKLSAIKASAERAVLLFRARESGTSRIKLGEAFGISTWRVNQLLWKGRRICEERARAAVDAYMTSGMSSPGAFAKVHFANVEDEHAVDDFLFALAAQSRDPVQS